MEIFSMNNLLKYLFISVFILLLHLFSYFSYAETRPSGRVTVKEMETPLLLI